jgi:hypothetical protein
VEFLSLRFGRMFGPFPDLVCLVVDPRERKLEAKPAAGMSPRPAGLPGVLRFGNLNPSSFAPFRCFHHFVELSLARDRIECRQLG